MSHQFEGWEFTREDNGTEEFRNMNFPQMTAKITEDGIVGIAVEDKLIAERDKQDGYIRTYENGKCFGHYADITTQDFLDSIESAFFDSEKNKLFVKAENLNLEDDIQTGVSETGDVYVNFYVGGNIQELDELCPYLPEYSNYYVNVYDTGDVTVEANGIEEQISTPEFVVSADDAKAIKEVCNAYCMQRDRKSLEQMIQEEDAESYKLNSVLWEHNTAMGLPTEVRIPVRVAMESKTNQEAIPSYLEHRYNDKATGYIMNKNLKHLLNNAKEKESPVLS